MTSLALLAALVVCGAPAKPTSTSAGKKAPPASTSSTRTLRSLTVTLPNTWKPNEDINKQSLDAMRGALKGADVDGAFYAADDFGMAYQLLFLRTEKIPAAVVQAELAGVGKGFKQSEVTAGSKFEKFSNTTTDNVATTEATVMSKDGWRMVKLIAFVDGDSRLISYGCTCHTTDLVENKPHRAQCEQIMATCVLGALK